MEWQVYQDVTFGLLVPLVIWLGRAILSLRDVIRDLKVAIGTKDPPAGLMGDMVVAKDDIGLHHEWLLIMRAKLGFDTDRRHTERRSH